MVFQASDRAFFHALLRKEPVNRSGQGVENKTSLLLLLQLLMLKVVFRKRVTGEEWLVDRVGAYLPGAFEEVRIYN